MSFTRPPSTGQFPFSQTPPNQSPLIRPPPGQSPLMQPHPNQSPSSQPPSSQQSQPPGPHPMPPHQQSNYYGYAAPGQPQPLVTDQPISYQQPFQGTGQGQGPRPGVGLANPNFNPASPNFTNQQPPPTYSPQLSANAWRPVGQTISGYPSHAGQGGQPINGPAMQDGPPMGGFVGQGGAPLSGHAGHARYPYPAQPSPGPPANLGFPLQSNPQPPSSGYSVQHTYSGQLGPAAGGMPLQAPITRGVNLFQTQASMPPPDVPAPPSRVPSGPQGPSCISEHMRCTLTSLPATASLQQKIGLPIGLHVLPFKSVPQESMPVIQPPTIVRCRACRTYINPFVTFLDGGRWQCNVCLRPNTLPNDYDFDPISRQPIARTQKPEIMSPMVEYIAPAEYMVRPPQPAAHFFLIDVSAQAVESGMVQSTVDTIKQCLSSLPGDDRRLVGLITFDTSLHFYRLKANQTQPQMMVVTDLQDVFLPSPSDILVNLVECNQLLVMLLDSLPSLCSSSSTAIGSATGAALQAAFKLMSATGGRILLFQGSMPSIDPGKMASREKPAVRGTQKEFQLLEPATDFYKNFAVDCSRQQIAVSVFLLGSGPMDIATIAPLAQYSGGNVYNYVDFHWKTYPAMVQKYERELKHVLTQPMGLEAVMRVRTSKGLHLHSFHGNFFVRSTDLLALPNVNADNTFAAQVAIDEDLSQSSMAFFQSALLYTTTQGERRIRVYTLAVSVTNDIATVFAGADQYAIAALLPKMAVERAKASKLTDAREAVLHVCTDSLKAYQSIAGNAETGLVAPLSLAYLPVMAYSLLKNPGLRLGTNTLLDTRTVAHTLYKSLWVDQLAAFLLPRLYALHNMSPETGTLDSNGHVIMPPLLPPMAASLSSNGLFILENGLTMHMYVGRAVPATVIESLFGYSSYQSLPPLQPGQTTHMTGLPDLDNDMAKRVAAILGKIRSQYKSELLMVVVKEDDVRLRTVFQQLLVLDKDDTMPSYQETLQHIHRSMS